MSTILDPKDIQEGDRVRRIVEYNISDKRDTVVTYELVSRPIKLPTEPGFYRSQGSNPDAKVTLFLNIYGVWSWAGNKTSLDPEVWDVEHVARYMPLTLLRPQDEVAAEVVEALQKSILHYAVMWETSTAVPGLSQLLTASIEAVAKEFGAQK